MSGAAARTGDLKEKMEKGNIEDGDKAFFMKTCKTKTCEIIAGN